jgi:hypothetical protein
MMSDLVKDLERRHEGVEREPSSLEVIMEQMTEEERSAVTKSLDLIRNDTRRGKAKVYSCAWLAKVLTNHGYPISRTTIRRYLNGEKTS